MNNRVLICTASTGQGHNTVAASLKEELEELGYVVGVIEPLREKSEHLGKFIDNGYKILATKMPLFYSGLYKFSNFVLVDATVNKMLVDMMNGTFADMINKFDPALIISTHPLLVKQISDLIRDGEVNVKFVSIVTDFQAHQAYICSNIDAYIVGSMPTKESLIKNGIDGSIIYPYGIPIKRNFTKIKGIFSKSDKFTVLVMGGSMGVKGMKKAFQNILNLDCIIKMIVVCAANKELKEDLEEILADYRGKKEIEILGYTDRVNELMSVSDLIVTKPGGLTVSESLSMKLPMIIPYYIPGQEAENTEIMSDAGVAMETDITELDKTLEKLINQPALLQYMKNNIEKLVETHSIKDTLILLEGLIKEYNREEQLVEEEI